VSAHSAERADGLGEGCELGNDVIARCKSRKEHDQWCAVAGAPTSWRAARQLALVHGAVGREPIIVRRRRDGDEHRIDHVDQPIVRSDVRLHDFPTNHCSGKALLALLLAADAQDALATRLVVHSDLDAVGVQRGDCANTQRSGHVGCEWLSVIAYRISFKDALVGAFATCLLRFLFLST